MKPISIKLRAKEVDAISKSPRNLISDYLFSKIIIPRISTGEPIINIRHSIIYELFAELKNQRNK